MKKFLVDSNVWIKLWKDYSREFDVSLWKKVEEYIDKGAFIVHYEVYKELMVKDDGLSEYVNKKGIVLSKKESYSKDVQDWMKKLFPDGTTHHDFLSSGCWHNKKKNTNWADGWLIPYAKKHHGLTILTNDFSGDKGIIYVCNQANVGVDAMTFNDFRMKEGWKF